MCKGEEPWAGNQAGPGCALTPCGFGRSQPLSLDIFSCKMVTLRVPWWLSRLRIQCCHGWIAAVAQVRSLSGNFCMPQVWPCEAGGQALLSPAAFGPMGGDEDLPWEPRPGPPLTEALGVTQQANEDVWKVGRRRAAGPGPGAPLDLPSPTYTPQSPYRHRPQLSNRHRQNSPGDFCSHWGQSPLAVSLGDGLLPPANSQIPQPALWPQWAG